MIEASEIGRRLKSLRNDKGISCEEFAREMEISTSAALKYESGERMPRDEVKVKIADFYGMTVQEIFFDEKCHV